MHARIYFLIAILTGIIISSFLDEKLSRLSAENQKLRLSLHLQKDHAVTDRRGAFEQLATRRGFSPVPSELSIMFSNGQDNSVERSLKDYREKIDLMESRLNRYRDERLGYQMMIDALKGEINLKDGELQQLRTRVAASQAENDTLTETLAQKERDLEGTLALLNNRENEAALDKKLRDLTQNLRFAEADACYARAQLTEAAADKIFLSPVRKKEYLREALEGYKKAFFLGKQEAAQDISVLEKSLLPKLASAQ